MMSRPDRGRGTVGVTNTATQRGRTLVVILLITIALSGCGYRLAGTGAPVLPEHIKVLVVLPFENRTTRTEIANNLVHGEIRFEGGRAEVRSNLSGRLEGYFEDPIAGNLALKRTASGAIDQAVRLPDVYAGE